MNNQTPRFTLLRHSDLVHLPPMSWLVKGVLPATGTAVIFGPSASGKSFLCLDLAIAISQGEPWFGQRVKATPVVYASLEATAGIKQRTDAWSTHYETDIPANLSFILDPINLTVPSDVVDLANSLPKNCVVFIDTLNRAASTIDENSSHDMGIVIDAINSIQRITGGLVVLVHHTGKNTDSGMRGHSSLNASIDAAIEVSRHADVRTWRIAKSKDGIDGLSKQFKLHVQGVGIDSDGDPITSCVVKPDESEELISSKPVPQGGNQKLVMDALYPLFESGQTGVVGAPESAQCIKLEVAVITGASKLTCPSDRKTARAREAITGLVNRGAVGLHDGWLWRN